MKRIAVAAAAAVGVIGLLGVGPLAATDENSPHSGPGSHPHHVHNPEGCQDIPAPNMEGGSRGLHNAANRENNANDENSHDNMHHGSCAAHGG